MGFYDTLRNSNGNSSIWGSGGSSKEYGIADALSLDAEYRRRDMNDRIQMQQQSQNQNPGMGQQRNRMQSLFNPQGPNPNGAPIGTDGMPMDVVFKDNNPDLMRPLGTREKIAVDRDRDRLAIEDRRYDQQRNLDRDKLALVKEDNVLARDKFGLEKEGHALDKLKNEQIFSTKTKDMERKAAESEARLGHAGRVLDLRTETSRATDADRDARRTLDSIRYERQLAQKDKQLSDANIFNTNRIRNENKRLDQAGTSTQTTTLDPEGRERTVTTKRGTGTHRGTVVKPPPPGRIRVRGPNGESGTLPVGTELPDGWEVQ